jgi:Kef-type K+ transport system membrane component KefB
MTLSVADLAHLLLSVAMLLCAAHAVGYVFARLRQPRVIGEIMGGLLLGPTVFGAIAPALQARVFPSSGPVPLVLDSIYQLGLLLLMFSAGAEIRATFGRGEKRTVAAIGTVGIALPFLAGLAFVAVVNPVAQRGAAATNSSFVLVFAIAIAVTSIPVISRIMFDLGILETDFARIVLGVAVIEDVVLYVLLAIALGLVANTSAEVFGLQQVLGIDPGSAMSVVYHVVVTIAFLGVSLAVGPPLYRRTNRFRYNVLKLGNPIGFQLVFMFVMTVIAVFFGVVPLFGAFVAGIIVGSSSAKSAARARESIKVFSFAFFIPIYFAIVGLRLDLIRDFQLPFFIAFFVFACVVKSLSVYLGARLGRESHVASTNLAVALNARGGPGIVLASVALDARIISEPFYATLVLLAILTSLLAGAWLERVIRAGRPLRPLRPVAGEVGAGARSQALNGPASRVAATDATPGRVDGSEGDERG